jgi:type VI secretion system secreted protein Hcp
MPFDAFIKIDGIPGESREPGHVNEIEILSFHWGVTQTGGSVTGGGGKADKKDLVIVKRMDVATPDIFLYCCTVKPIKEVVLTCRKAGKPETEYLQIVLTNAMISSVNYAGNQGGDEVPLEEVSFNFVEMRVTFTSQETGTQKSRVYNWKIGKGA